MNKSTPITFQRLPMVCEHPVQLECSAAEWIWRFVAPCIVLVGTVGNTLALVVLSRKRLRNLAVVIHLLFLAVTDETFLVVNVTRQYMLRITGTDIQSLSKFSCVVYRWITFTAVGMSPWLIVLLTLERAYVTVYPHGRVRVTRKMALVASVTLLIVISLSNVTHIVSFDLVKVNVSTIAENGTSSTGFLYACQPRTLAHNAFIVDKWKTIVFIVYNVIPLLFIVSGNAAILIKLVYQRLKIRTRVHPGPGSTSGHGQSRDAATRMVLFVSAFFLCTTIPYTSFTVIINRYFKDVTDIKTVARLQLVSTLTNMFLYCNFSFNFWLYFASGSLFKEEWKKIVSLVRNRFQSIASNFRQQRRPPQNQPNQPQNRTGLDREIGGQAGNNEQDTQNDNVIQIDNNEPIDDNTQSIELRTLN